MNAIPLLDIIARTITPETAHPDDTGLQCSDPAYTQTVIQPHLPNVTIMGSKQVHVNLGTPKARMDTYLQVEFNFEEFQGPSIANTMSSYHDSSIYLDTRKLAHDLTSLWLIGEDFTTTQQLGDQPLSQIEELHDHSDTLTPDFIHHNVINNEYYVVEFTTIRHNANELTLRNSFLAKKERYQHELQLRSENAKIYFFILVVCSDGIMTNLDVDDATLGELIARIRTATQIITLAIAENYIIEEEEGDAESQEMKYKKDKVVNFFEWFNSDRKFLDNPVRANFSLDKLENIHARDVTYTDRLISDLWTDAKKTTLTNAGKSLNSLKDPLNSVVMEENDKARSEAEETYNNKTISNFNAMQKGSHDVVFHNGAFRDPYDKKTIVNLPLITPTMSQRESSDVRSFAQTHYWSHLIHNQYDNYPIAALCFKYALQQVESGNGRFDEDNAAELNLFDKVLTPKEEKELKKDRNKYRRVDISLSATMSEELAQYGVGAKKHNKLFSVQQIRQKSKLVMPLDTDLTDLTSMIMNSHKLFETNSVLNPGHLTVKELYEESLNNHFNDSTKFENVNKWSMVTTSLLESNMAIASTIISDIAMELSLSLKQNVSKKQTFILKKLRRFDILILIKSVSYQAPLFFSLMWDTNKFKDLNVGSVFRDYETIGGLACTEFMSVKRDKLENWIRCESMFVTMVAYWSEFYSNTVFKTMPNAENKVDNHESMYKMILLSMLVQLENKERTEEVCTKARYLLMEGFVNYPEYCKPFKMYNKLLSNPIRSRLQLFFVNKLLDAGKRICSTMGFRIQINDENREEGGTNKIWLNMFNPYTDEILASPYQLVNLMYLGYLKDKNIQAERNVSFKLYEKILEWEMKKPSQEQILQGANPINKPDPHAYSGSLLYAVLQSAQDQLSNEYGNNFKDQIKKEIYHVLANTDAEDMATLKASAKFTKETEKNVSALAQEKNIPKELVDNKKVKELLGKPQRRPKAIQSIIHLLESSDGCSLMDLMPTVMNALHEDDCMRIDLFKKPQHGGLREIYVLQITSRLMQFMLEAMAKVVCKMFKSETMTNPKSKMLIPLEHTKQATAAFGEDFITINDSADAEKWNQGHYVPKFSYMLKFFMPKEMHPFIDFGCYLFTKKKIMISEDVMSALYMSRVGFSSPIFQLMSDCIARGTNEQPWASPGSNYITTETGMMQGILHYTSSLWHTLYLEYFKRLSQKILRLEWRLRCESLGLCEKGSRPSNIPGYEAPIIHSMASSDDSGIQASFRKLDTAIGCFMLFYISALFRLRHLLSIYLGIYPSPKCTTVTACAFEYNSEFYFASNHFRPTFRWVVSALVLSEQGCYTSRQEENSTNLSAVLSGGGSFGLCSIIQWAQLLLHYRTFGSSVNPHFSIFTDKLLKIKDPSLGFYLVDNPFTAGLFGFRYNLWKALQNERLSKLYSHMLETHTIKKSEQTGASVESAFEVTRSGALTANSALIVTNQEIWERTIKAMNFPPDWSEQLDAKPVVLYRRAGNVDEMLLKLAEKMHSPGIVQSLSAHDALNKIISSSVFALTRQCLVSRILKDNPGKVSLLKLINTALEKSNQANVLSNNQMLVLIPQHNLFYEYSKWVDSLRFVGQWIETRLSKKNVTVNVEYVDDVNFIKPESLIRSQWFGLSGPKYHRAIIARAWENLKMCLPWLHDKDYQQSLQDSPFTTHIQLRNFISRLDVQNRVVVISGVYAKARLGVSNYTSVVLNNFAPGLRLNFPETIDSDEDNYEIPLGTVKHCLKVLVQGPFTDNFQKQTVNHILRTSNITEDTINPHSRNNKLYLMKLAAQSRGEKYETQRIVQSIIRTRLGVIGCFVETQVLQDTKWSGKGVWTGYMDGKKFSIVVVGKNITKVYVEPGFNYMDLPKVIPLIFPTMSYVTDQSSMGFLKVGYINKSTFSQGKLQDSCPVFTSVFTDQEAHFTLDKIKHFDVVPTGHHINLVAVVDAKPRTHRGVKQPPKHAEHRLPVLNYYVRDEDIIRCKKTDINDLLNLGLDENMLDKSPIINWMNLTGLHYSQVPGFIEKIKKGEADGRIDYEKMTEALKSLTMTYIRGSSTGGTQMLLQTAEEVAAFDQQSYNRILGYAQDTITRDFEDTVAGGVEAFNEEVEKSGISFYDNNTKEFDIPDLLKDITADFYDAIENKQMNTSVAIRYYHDFLKPFFEEASRVAGGSPRLCEHLRNKTLPGGLEPVKEVFEFLLDSELKIETSTITIGEYVDIA